MSNNEDNNLGMGVMIGWLSGNEETVDAIKKSTDKEIASIQLTKRLGLDEYEPEKYKDIIILTFTDETGIRFWDGGQSCCEHRYMTCDDEKEFPSFVGAKFLKAELATAPAQGAEYDVHEIQFLNIITSKGVIQCVTHNVHNGYYGGFWIQADTHIGEEG